MIADKRADNGKFVVRTNEGLSIHSKKDEVRISFKHAGKDVILLSLKQEDYKNGGIKETWIECLDVNLEEIKGAVGKYQNELLAEEKKIRKEAIEILMENFNKTKLKRTIS